MCRIILDKNEQITSKDTKKQYFFYELRKMENMFSNCPQMNRTVLKCIELFKLTNDEPIID